MKPCSQILLILFCIFIFSGCESEPSSYPFPNRSVSIEKVELIQNHNEFGEGTDESNMHLIKTLDDSEALSFMEEIYNLPTKRAGTPPPWGYGVYIAKVIYSNGDIEMLGSLNIEFIENGNAATGIGSYYFPDDSFIPVFEKYSNP